MALSTLNDVFISLRFAESLPAALALRDSLRLEGVRVFVCEVPPGDDIASTVMDQLHGCRMVIVMGTATYGKKTAAKFSTFEELRFIIDENKPFFLIKMCDAFKEHKTRFWLPSTVSYYMWQPDMDNVVVPAALVKDILAKLNSIHVNGAGVGGRAYSVTTLDNHNVAVIPSAAMSNAVAGGGAAATGAATGGSAVAGSGAVVDDELTAWLSKIDLKEMMAPLCALGVVSMKKLQGAVQRNFLSAEMLKQHGAKPIPAVQFIDETKILFCSVSDGREKVGCRKEITPVCGSICLCGQTNATTGVSAGSTVVDDELAAWLKPDVRNFSVSKVRVPWKKDQDIFLCHGLVIVANCEMSMVL